MLSLPPQFQRELENVARKPFALLQISSTGQSDEITSEADFGTATAESSVGHNTTDIDLTSAAYKWTLSGSGTNEYYCELAAGGDPSLPEQSILLMDEVWLTKGTLGSLADHEFGYGDNDSLGYNTIYVADATGDPDTSGVSIEITGGPPDEPGNCVLLPDGTTTTATGGIFPTTDAYVGNVSFNGASVGYDCVDDPVATPDDDATYIRFSFGHEWRGGDLTYQILQNVPEKVGIQKVTVHYRGKIEQVIVSNQDCKMEYNGTTYSIGVQGLGSDTNYHDWSFDVTVPPDGSVGGWTRAKLQLIESIGVYTYSSHWLRLTQMYMTVTYFGVQGSGSITLPFDLGANANTANNAIVSIDDYVPTGSAIAYTMEGSDAGTWTGEEASLGVVVDGSSISGYRYYRPTAVFTSSGTVTGVLKSIKIEIPDNVYRFNNRPGDNIFNSLPFLKSVPTRTIKLNLSSFMTESSRSSFTLAMTEEVEQMLQENDPFSDLAAELKVGFYTDDITNDDMVTLYPGLTVDYSISGGIVKVTIKDPMETLQVKWPAGSAPSTLPTKSYDGIHLCDVILDIANTVGTPSRWIDRGSLGNLKATVGSGSPASANYVAKRLTTNAVTESKPARDHIAEILHVLGAFLIIQESGKMTFVEYDSAATAGDTWTGDYPDDFKGSPSFSPGLDKTRDVCRVWYNYDGSDYGSIHIEVAAADSKKIKDIKSKWISGTASDGYYGKEIAEAVGPREIARLGSGLPPFSCQTSLDKFEVQVGDMVNIKHPSIVSPDDSPEDTVKFLVTRKTPDIPGGRISWDLARAS